MTLRSQTVALIVLFVALGIVFALAADAGISTKVFTPDSTLTATATIGPTATPSPEPGLDHWTETEGGNLTYSADPSLQVQLTYRESPIADFSTQMELAPLAEDSAYPVLDLLGQMRAAYEQQASEVQLSLTADAFTGPYIELVEGQPVAILRLQIAPQDMADGRSFPGMDVAQVLIDQGAGNIVWVQYMLQGEQNPVVYNDFRAWLAAKITEFTTQAEAEPTAEGTVEPTVEGTPEATVEATAEPAEIEPTVEATVEPTIEPTVEATEIAPTEAATPAP